MFISSSVSEDDVVGFLLVTVREVVVVVPILLAIGLVAVYLLQVCTFLTAFFQMSSMMTVQEIMSNK